ncbi:hypothetical protein CANARDRAFT_23607 [[Candida] arabinofermentans NRRL YB-2248]|uniref:Pre-mRNA-splicing factor BUD31 n=1 Tax=[Candida] arabinofermentans NRRL YB-2248 TaxID=983967 RepID=A0A1E4SZZ0_9ASCO|nr:hypothetical protein CANARDRAFT_23607 [[Candida] arabinofermentans NRRL YB-2248]
MPKVPSTNSKFKKKPPHGFSKIEPTLTKFSQKLKLAESKPLKLNTPKHESLWEIVQLNHQRSRYIYELYYKKKIISKELYDWLIKNKFGDLELIAKWKKQGYENLCCLKCMLGKENNHGTTCICRVPKSSLKNTITGDGEVDNDNDNDNGHGKERDIRCVNCGCRGCASGDL